MKIGKRDGEILTRWKIKEEKLIEKGGGGALSTTVPASP